MRAVLITGASGFIGRALEERLSSEKLITHAMKRKDGDITDSKTLSSLPRCSLVFHLAGRSYVPDSWLQPQEFVRVNVNGTQNIINYCLEKDAHLIFASTYVYGLPTTLPIDETHPVRPSNPYAESKHLAEQMCISASTCSGLKVTILRIFNVYGPSQKQEFLIPTILRQIFHADAIRVQDLRPKRDYLYVDDVVDAFIRAGEHKPINCALNIGSGQSYSVSEVIEAAQQVAGSRLPIISDFVERPLEIFDIRADYSMAERLLGWSPRYSLRDGLEKTIIMSPQSC